MHLANFSSPYTFASISTWLDHTPCGLPFSTGGRKITAFQITPAYKSPLPSQHNEISWTTSRTWRLQLQLLTERESLRNDFTTKDWSHERPRERLSRSWNEYRTGPSITSRSVWCEMCALGLIDHAQRFWSKQIN